MHAVQVVYIDGEGDTRGLGGQIRELFCISSAVKSVRRTMGISHEISESRKLTLITTKSVKSSDLIKTRYSAVQPTCRPTAVSTG